jgi:hypothetical protein
MTAWMWALVAIAVVVAVAALALAALTQRRSSRLRNAFGPEYDRAVESGGRRRRAEAQLRGRERQRSRFAVEPLPEPARLRFVTEWRAAQEHFVDQPANAVRMADELVTRVLDARGYPAGDFAARVDLVSVDHPDVVDSYRQAHGVTNRAPTQPVDTEDLRGAFLRYRLLFDQLVQPATATASTSEPSPSEPEPQPAQQPQQPARQPEQQEPVREREPADTVRIGAARVDPDREGNRI